MSYRESYPDFYKLADVLEVPEQNICCDISGLNFTLWKESASGEIVGINMQHSSLHEGITLEVKHLKNDTLFSGSTNFTYKRVECVTSIIEAVEKGRSTLSEVASDQNQLIFSVSGMRNIEIHSEILKRRITYNEVHDGFFNRIFNWMKCKLKDGLRERF